MRRPLSGKWHLGYGSAARVDFTKRAFRRGRSISASTITFRSRSNHGDISGVYVENRHVVGLRSSQLKDRKQAGLNFNKTAYLGLDAPHRVDENVMPELTDKVVEWLGKQTSDKPFFSLLHTGGHSQSGQLPRRKPMVRRRPASTVIGFTNWTFRSDVSWMSSTREAWPEYERLVLQRQRRSRQTAACRQ